MRSLGRNENVVCCNTKDNERKFLCDRVIDYSHGKKTKSLRICWRAFQEAKTSPICLGPGTKDIIWKPLPVLVVNWTREKKLEDRTVTVIQLLRVTFSVLRTKGESSRLVHAGQVFCRWAPSTPLGRAGGRGCSAPSAWQLTLKTTQTLNIEHL